MRPWSTLGPACLGFGYSLAFAALPAPLGSLRELLVPPGTPRTDGYAAYASACGPCRRRARSAPPATPPPEDDPPPPLLWAKLADPIKLATMATTTTAGDLDMWGLLNKPDLDDPGDGFVPAPAVQGRMILIGREYANLRPVKSVLLVSLGIKKLGFQSGRDLTSLART